MENKKYSLLPLLAATLMLVFVSLARAESDDEDRNERRQSSTAAPQISQPVPAASVEETSEVAQPDAPKQPKVPKTIISPQTIITQTIMQNITLADYDRDGVADENDPHPNIAEHLIVNDSNFDGIDDRYEI
jgi:hypothetical protein